MSEFARRNLIIADGLANNIEDSEKEQKFHLERAANALDIKLKNLTIEESSTILWRELRKKSNTKLSLYFNKSIKKIFFILLLITLFLASFLIFSSKDISPTKTRKKTKLINLGYKWKANYYDNVGLTGIPLLTTSHDIVSFKWEGKEPNKIIKPDIFSARYKTCLELKENKTAQITLGSDDGTKLLINNNLVINNWRKQGYNELKKSVPLEKGKHIFEIHYFQNGGSSRLEFKSNLELKKCP